MKYFFKIFGKNGRFVGSVCAISPGDAKNKAVSEKLVPGRKQITKVVQSQNHDFYEQSYQDIYG